MRKRFVAMLLVLGMVIGFLPASAQAYYNGYNYSSQYKSSKYFTQLKNVKLTGNQATDIVNIALSQKGYHEGNSSSDLGGNSSGGNNYCEYNHDYYYNTSKKKTIDGGENYSWCAVFVSWCARQAGISTGIIKNFSGCTDAYNGGLSGTRHLASSGYKPQKGDLFFVGSAKALTHVGIVAENATGNTFVSIEGNASDAVRSRTKKISSVYGFITPNYQTASRNIKLKAWISDSKMGNRVDYLELGKRYYLCYQIYDENSGALYHTFANTNYKVTETVLNPSGKTHSSYTYSNDNNWLSFIPQTTGNWSGKVQISGGISGSTGGTVKARNTTLRVWISNSKNGGAVSYLEEGKTYYTCYKLYDSGTGDLYENYKPKNASYTVTHTLESADGSNQVKQTNVSQANSSFTVSALGGYAYGVELAGSIKLSASYHASAYNKVVASIIGTPIKGADIAVGTPVDVVLGDTLTVVPDTSGNDSLDSPLQAVLDVDTDAEAISEEDENITLDDEPEPESELEPELEYDPTSDPIHAITLQINNPRISIDGAPSTIDAQGTTPVIINGRTMLPIRAVMEAMGGAVEWESASKTAILHRDGKTLYLRIGQSYCWDDGDMAILLDSPPVILNSRTLLPLRAVMEYFGASVAWESATKTVTITY